MNDSTDKDTNTLNAIVSVAVAPDAVFTDTAVPSKCVPYGAHHARQVGSEVEAAVPAAISVREDCKDYEIAVSRVLDSAVIIP